MKYKMESKDNLKETDFKNHACHYFDDIINGIDINFNDILLDNKIYGTILFYNISYKTPPDPKALRIRFDETDGFIRMVVVKLHI